MNKRKIEPDVLGAIDSATNDNPDVQLAIASKSWRPLITMSAAAWGGVKEHSNNNDGNFVEMSGLTVDGKHNGEAYCLSWVQTVIAYAETKLNMISPLKATEGCLDLWRSTPQAYKTTKFPIAGYIAIWQHGTSPAGHAGIVLKVEDGHFKCIEANSVGPDGISQGIFEQKRSFNGEGKMRLLGFISPF